MDRERPDQSHGGRVRRAGTRFKAEIRRTVSPHDRRASEHPQGHREQEDRRPFVRRGVIRLALGVAAMFLVVLLVFPQVAGLDATARQLARARWWLVPSALLLEAGSLLAYGELVLLVLRRGGLRPRRGLIQRATVCGFSLGRTLPGGSTSALAVIVGVLRANGLDGTKAAAFLAATGVLSAAVLAFLLPIGSLLAIIGGETAGIALGAAVAAAAIVATVTLLPLAVRSPDRVATLVARLVSHVARGPLRKWIQSDRVEATVEEGLRTGRALVTDRRAVFRAGAWAAANWLLDVAAFAVLAGTVGRGTPLAPLLLAYVIAQLLQAVPLTPGGVGIVETGMTAALVAGGAPAVAAAVTVLGWRLVSHWIPIVIGLALLPGLAPRKDRHRH